MNPLFQQLFRQATQRLPGSANQITQGISRGFSSLKPVAENVRNITGSALQRTFGPEAGRLIPGTFNPSGINTAFPVRAPSIPPRLATGLLPASPGGAAVLPGRLLQGLLSNNPVTLGATETLGHLAFPPGIEYSSAHGTLQDPAIRLANVKADQARPIGTRAVLNNKPVFWTGDKYGWQTGPSALRAGLLGSEITGDEAYAISQVTPPAPTLPPPSSFTTTTTTTTTAASGGPAERALQREKVQAAAQVATNPLMQQWEAAKQAKDFEKADELGMQIWQSKYGKTPLGQPGGALGTTNPLMQSTFGYQANMSPRDISKVITNPSPASPQPSEASIQMGDLGTRAMGDTGYDPAAYGITPEQIEAIKQKLLAQAKK